MRSDQRRIGPVEQAGGCSMMLSYHEQLPVVGWRRLEAGPRIPSKIAQYVLLEVNLRVRRIRASEPVKRRKKGVMHGGRAVINPRITPTTYLGMRLAWCDHVDQFAEAAYRTFFQRL